MAAMFGRIAPALLAALALAGCGQTQTGDTGDFSGEEAAVADVVGELSESATRGEASTVCSDILSQRLEEEITEDDSSCINEVEKAFDDADAFIVDVDDVAVTGDEATAEVSSENADDRVRRTFELVQEDGNWRIDSFG